MAFDVTGAKVARKLAARTAGTCRVFVGQDTMLHVAGSALKLSLATVSLSSNRASPGRTNLHANGAQCFRLNHQKNTEKSAPAKSTETVDSLLEPHFAPCMLRFV